jgi:fibronectin-binding autotransporter adhesin
VIAGAYSYNLFHNGIADPGDGDWYLRSGFAATVPAYEAYPAVLLTLFDLESLQGRTGNRSWSGAGSAGPAGLSTQAPDVVQGSGLWAQIKGAHASIEPESSTSGASYDTSIWQLQAGLDAPLHEGAVGRLIAGVTGHFGKASADISAAAGDGEISTEGWGVGGTLTWFGASGFYADAQGQTTWLDSDLAALGSVEGNDGFGYALSLEAGQRIGLDPNWTVTPQAQLVYAEVDFDSFTDGFGTAVSLDDGDSLKGRLGLAADYEDGWYDEAGAATRIHLYGIANLYYHFDASTAVEVSGVTVSSETEGLWGGIGGGGSVNWADDRYSLYAAAALNTSLEGFADSYSVSATAGLRVNW